jgi:hypothetical protein
VNAELSHALGEAAKGFQEWLRRGWIEGAADKCLNRLLVRKVRRHPRGLLLCFSHGLEHRSFKASRQLV